VGTDERDEEEVRYLTDDDVIGLHADILGCTDRQATDQLRSTDGLEGAIARPLWHAVYGGADLAMQAAVLAHGIAEGQLFIDVNKRTALAALRTFLRVNGWDVAATQQERADWILSIAHGATPAELADRLRAVLVRLPAEPAHEYPRQG
jgi:death-on-curing protein